MDHLRGSLDHELVRNQVSCDNPYLEFCTDLQGGFRALYDEQGQSELWVHAKCGFPSEAVFEDYRRMCQVCRIKFSAPYERLCKTCSDSDPYKSWTWVRDQSDLWHPARNPA